MADVTMEDVPRQFVPRKGTSGGLAGNVNEVYLVMLFLAKALESEEVQSFHLGSNVDGVSDFDDLVFVYRNKENKSRAVFLQAKHTEYPKKYPINLLDTLKNYLSCYIDIKSQLNIEDHCVQYLFFTNAPIKSGHKCPIKNMERHEFLNFFQKEPNKTYNIDYQKKKREVKKLVKDLMEPMDFSEIVDALVENYSKRKISLCRKIYIKYFFFLKNHVWKINGRNCSFQPNFLDGSSTHKSAVDLSKAFIKKISKIIEKDENIIKIDENRVKDTLKKLTWEIYRIPNSNENQESKRMLVSKITLDDINEFFGRFYLFVNQPGVDALKKMLIDIIMKRFDNLTDAECNIVFNYVSDRILSWRINANRSNKIDYFTEKNDFFEEGKNLLSWLKMASSLNKTLSKSSKIDKFCIQFEKGYNIESSVVGIVISNDEERVLHLARLRQTLNSKFGSKPYYYYTVKENIHDVCVIESFKNFFDLLILDLHGSSQISVKQRTELEQVITLNPKKKVILVGKELILNNFGIEIDTWNDKSVGFADLEQKTQEKILNEMEISFQGRPMKLIDIFPKPWQDNRHLIDSSTLARMIGQDECYSIGPKYDLNMDDFIQRYLRLIIVSEFCFRDNQLSFAVSGIDYEELENLRKWTNRSDVDIRYVENVDDFDSLQVPEGRSLHWLEKTFESTYLWLKSRLHFDHLRPYVSNYVYRADPKLINDEVVLVVAEPGMGKTTLLSMMANIYYSSDSKYSNDSNESSDSSDSGDSSDSSDSIDSATWNILPYWDSSFYEMNFDDITDKFALAAAEPGTVKTMLLPMIANSRKNDTWNIVLYLNDHSTQLKKWKDRSMDIDQTLDFLAASLHLDTFGKALLSYRINVYGEINIFLDGFDEICPSHGDTVVNLVNTLKNRMVNKIWVSSRVYMTEYLESKLRVFAYPIYPLIDYQPGEFLLQYWTKFLNLNNFIAVDESLQEFISRLLGYFHQTTKEIEFLGNPLHLRMLGDYYKEDLIQFILARDFLFDDTAFKPLSMFDLYDRIIRTKYFDIWKKEKLASREIVTEMEEEQSAHEYENFEEDHKYLACFAILDDDRLKQILTPIQMEKTKEKIKGIVKGNEKRGMINNVIDGKPVFVHRTFAEFILSKMLTDLLKCDFDTSQGFLFKFDYFKRSSTLIRTFLDFYLSMKEPLFKAAFTNNTKVINEIENPSSLDVRDALNRSPLYLASFYGNTEAVKAILVKFNGNISSVDKLDEWTPIQVASSFKHWSIVEALLLHGADPSQIDNIESLLKYLVSQENFQLVKKLTENCDFSLIHMLSICALQIKNIDMVMYLISKGADPIPILKHFWHEDKIFFKTLLWDIKEMNLVLFNKSLKNCLLNGIDKMDYEIFKVVHELGVEIGDMDTECNSELDFCQSKRGASLDAIDDKKNPLEKDISSAISLLTDDDSLQIFNAVSVGDLDATKKLLDIRLELISRQLRNGTTLLHVAAFRGHVEIVEYLLEKGAKVVVYDSRNMSPLHLAFARSWAAPVTLKTFETTYLTVSTTVVELLERYGAKATDCNSSGWMVLHTVIQLIGEHSVLSYLERVPEKEQWINRADSNGSTLLHEPNTYRIIIKQLIKKGADAHQLDKLGCGPVFRYLMKDMIDYVSEWFIKTMSATLRTLVLRRPVSELHFAVAMGSLHNVKWLIKDARLDVDLGRGQCATPLHFAVALDEWLIKDYLIEMGADQRALAEVTDESRIILLEFIKEKAKFNEEKCDRKIVYFDSLKRLLAPLDAFSNTFQNEYQSK